jgi:putative ATP-dependent endonuclease of the OLD family
MQRMIDMIIEKVNIQNYKCFYGKFPIEFNKGVNILVGDNEAGKSTILEAVHLALTGILNGRYLRNELSQYLFNHKIISEYIYGINHGNNPVLPEIVIEVFFSGNEFPLFEGNGNSEKIKKCGIVFKIEFDPEYQNAYQALIAEANNLTTIPIEYYRISWKSCAREPVTSRSIPVKSVLIDSSSNKYQNGSDIYISRIINNDLEENERVQLSQAYRKMKESFMADASVQAINQKISAASKVTEKNLSISVDFSTQNSWETTLMTYLDEIPFHQIGKGEQCVIKTNLALGHQKSQEANLILLEEPENHLSHTKLNELIKGITNGCVDKQVIISTHSSFVANKLGLENLLLLNNQKVSRLSDLTEETFTFFKKLPGYQTLRLLLCKKAVLVEGDSDELVFQKAYRENHNNHLPIENGIDVIAVKLSFIRFLEIAVKIGQPVAIITDNDHNFDNNIKKKYQDYAEINFIKIFADTRNELNTLEPQFVNANIQNLKNLIDVLGIDNKIYDTVEKICDYMTSNKTTWALKVFESDKKVIYPEYIQKAVAWCDEN